MKEIKKETEKEIMAHLESIIETTNRLTSGNFMHNKNSIILSTKIIINRLKESGYGSEENTE